MSADHTTSFATGAPQATQDGSRFAAWLLDVLKPSLMVDAEGAMREDYLEWCRAIELLGLATHCYAVDTSGIGLEGAQEVLAEHEASFSTFSHLVQTDAASALDAFPQEAVDLLIVSDTNEANGPGLTLDQWIPKMSPRGVVLVRKVASSASTALSTEAQWESLRDRYPSLDVADGQHRLILVGIDVPARIRDIFGPQDQGAAIEATLREASPSRATQDLQILVQRLAAQAEELEQMRRALSEKESLLGTLDSERRSGELKIKALTRALEHADISSQATLENLQVARREVSALIGSRSWTVTAPLRGVTTVLRYGRDIVRGSVRYVRSVRSRIVARGLRQATREVATTLVKPRQLFRLLTGRSGGELAPVYRLDRPRPASERLAQRILIVAEMSLAQCLKYRVLQKQRMIQDLGIDCTVVSWHDVPSARDFLQTHTMAIFYRVPGFDPQIETIRMARELGIPTFWEVDDLIFDEALYKTNSNLQDLHKKTREGIMAGVPLYRKAMLACDACIASTQALADVMRSTGVSTVHVIENALDDETIRIAEEINVSPKKRDGLIRIVYGSGSASHDSDFRVVAPALLTVLRARYDVRLTIIGSLNLPEEFKPLESQVERLPPSDYATYMKRLARCDINIAPLEISVFNDAKSNIKYLEAAILKLPSVCSATAEFRATIDQGTTGFLAAATAEWEEMLFRLVEDEALRNEVGQRAHDHVAAHYTPGTIARERVEPVLVPYRRFAPDKLRVLGVNIFFEPRSFGGATIVAEQVARRINAGSDIDYAMLTSLPTSDVHPYKLLRYQSSAAEVFAMGLPFEGNQAFDFDNPYPAIGFREILRSWRPDVVHLHSIQGFGVQIAEVCVAEGIPFVVTAHDAWWICARQFMITNEGKYCHQRKVDINVCAKCVVNPALNPYRQFRLHEVLSQADRLVVPSAFFRQLYIDNGFDADRTLVNKNGVVPPRTVAQRSPVSSRPLRLGFVGGEGPAKGSELIKQVLREMPEHINYELLVVDGALNLGRRVIFETTWDIPGTLKIVPAYTQDTIDEFFAGVDVLLFPTQCKESFGLSVREAMIRNVWVISTDAGGAVEDIVPGENGDVVPLEDDGANFKAALKRLLDNPGLLDGYRNTHVDMIRVFDEQAVELTGLLQDVARRHPVDHEERRLEERERRD
jgi:glycosyltransferase involved in cell wall biosynthesis